MNLFAGLEKASTKKRVWNVRGRHAEHAQPHGQQPQGQHQIAQDSALPSSRPTNSASPPTALPPKDAVPKVASKDGILERVQLPRELAAPAERGSGDKSLRGRRPRAPPVILRAQSAPRSPPTWGTLGSAMTSASAKKVRSVAG